MIRNRSVYFLSAPEVLEQMNKAQLSDFLYDVTMTDSTIAGFVAKTNIPLLLEQLRKDERFQEGVFFGLHHDVGKKLTDFRSLRNALGKGSLQIVIDKETGRFYADVDRFAVYEDLFNFLGHTGEVIAGFFGGWHRKDKQA